MHLLHLDASALGAHSATRELSAAIVDRWSSAVPGVRVDYRDLDADPLPHLTGAALARADPAAARPAREELDQFLAAAAVVIGAPLAVVVAAVWTVVIAVQASDTSVAAPSVVDDRSAAPAMQAIPPARLDNGIDPLAIESLRSLQQPGHPVCLAVQLSIGQALTPENRGNTVRLLYSLSLKQFVYGTVPRVCRFCIIESFHQKLLFLLG